MICLLTLLVRGGEVVAAVAEVTAEVCDALHWAELTRNREQAQHHIDDRGVRTGLAASRSAGPRQPYLARCRRLDELTPPQKAEATRDVSGA